MNINATLFVEVIIFIAFVMLTRVYVWPPILAIIEERQREIQKGIEQARESIRKKDETEQACHALMEQARTKAKHIEAQGTEAYNEKIKAAVTEAKEQAAHILAQAESQIKVTQQEAQGHVIDETERLLKVALTKILPGIPQQEIIDPMIDKALGEVVDES